MMLHGSRIHQPLLVPAHSAAPIASTVPAAARSEGVGVDLFDQEREELSVSSLP